MKLLLTSNGLSNDSIAKAFQELIGKDPTNAKVAFIPTAANPERGNKDWLINDMYRIHKQGYNVDIVELTALKNDEIAKTLTEANAVFVGGGNTFFLSYWMQKTGLFELIPELLKQGKVYAGISAGSMITGRSLMESQAIKDGYLDEHYYEKSVVGQGSNKSLNLVDIIFRPHLNAQDFPMVREDVLEEVAPKFSYPVYALDDNSALKIVGGKIEPISEGTWKVFND